MDIGGGFTSVGKPTDIFKIVLNTIGSGINFVPHCLRLHFKIKYLIFHSSISHYKKLHMRFHSTLFTTFQFSSFYYVVKGGVDVHFTLNYIVKEKFLTRRQC